MYPRSNGHAHRTLLPAGVLAESSEEIIHFSLQGILSPDQSLALNTTLGTLSLLVDRDGKPVLVSEQQLTTGEMCAFLPLLEHYPYYAPYENLLASFLTGKASELAIARYRKRLQDAKQHDEENKDEEQTSATAWDQEMRPLRNALSRVRLKVRSLGLEVNSILETGYILMAYGPSRR